MKKKYIFTDHKTVRPISKAEEKEIIRKNNSNIASNDLSKMLNCQFIISEDVAKSITKPKPKSKPVETKPCTDSKSKPCKRKSASPETLSKASKTLRDKRSSQVSKSLAGSILSTSKPKNKRGKKK